jgi:hypothetical protein
MCDSSGHGLGRGTFNIEHENLNVAREIGGDDKY